MTAFIQVPGGVVALGYENYFQLSAEPVQRPEYPGNVYILIPKRSQAALREVNGSVELFHDQDTTPSELNCD